MSLIKYPSHITPSRLTTQLVRSDELFMSPVTGMQQTASRGNAYWRWTLEYKDLSDSERDTVQAFLMKCKGSLNSFKVPDFGNYGVVGVASDWTDVFSGTGSFAGSGTFNDVADVTNTVMEYDFLNESQGGMRATRTDNLSRAVAVSSGTQYTVGATYVSRIKVFNQGFPMNISFYVGCYYQYAYGPSAVKSDDAISVPWMTNTGFIQHSGFLMTGAASSLYQSGHYHDFYDYRISRAAAVSNSENLLTHSNNFANAIWTKSTATNIVSGYAYSAPTGVTSGAWKLFPTAVTSQFYLVNTYSKPMTEELYTASLYARAVEQGEIRLQIDGGSASHSASAVFWLSSGTYSNLAVVGSFSRAHAQIFPLINSWYKCTLSAVTDSASAIRYVTYLASGTQVTFTGNGSAGVEIFGAQLRRSPYSGHYTPTTDTVIPGSGWQTGSKLHVEGLSVNTVVARAGTRFELINRYHDSSAGVYERSEFKRLTNDLISHREGWGIMEFDPPIRNAPVSMRDLGNFDGHLGETIHPVVVFDQPELKARLLGSTIQYVEKPLKLTDITFDIIEDLAE